MNDFVLTDDIKKVYFEYINKIYPNVFSSFSYQDVTEEVAEIVNEILDSVYTCSFQVNIVKTAIESVVMAGGIVGKTLSYGLKLALAAHSVEISSMTSVAPA